tara:strand:+ start:4911 stop:5234 length:324 start_codon:yes stop_codon:yes gene_type:complete
MTWQDIIKISTRDAISDARRFMPEEAGERNEAISKKRAILDSYRNIVKEEFFETERGRKFQEVLEEGYDLIDYYENSYKGDESELQNELQNNFYPLLVQLRELAKRN